ncbi:phosphotriesterase [Streptacidiphilus sp. EB129]|uniref:phosphotriesterase family protein n=1 Tax=Streptacidiphilus sp. EB129 TaxID=3156262 RepID=UPI003512CC43
MVAHVQTVTGPVDPGELGGVLSHEHLLALTPGPWLSGGPRPDRATDGRADTDAFEQEQVRLAVDALSGLAGHGIGTVVDLSPYGDAGRDIRGANVRLLQEISRRSGLHIVSGTATYREGFSPAWVKEASVEEIADRFVQDARSGIGGTGVRAGILGELPTGLNEVTAHELKGLRAAARAHHATGLAVNTHTTHGTMALEQIDLLTKEGVDPDRIVIGHMDNHPDLDYVRRVLDRGVTIAFDSVGKQTWDVRLPPAPGPQADGGYTKDAVRQSDATRADRLAALVAEGHGERILLSQDLTGGQVHQNPTTHGQWGYTYLSAVFLPMLTERGITPAQLHALTHTTPARLLTLD